MSSGCNEIGYGEGIRDEFDGLDERPDLVGWGEG